MLMLSEIHIRIMVRRSHDNLLTPSFISDSKIKNHRRIKGHYGTGVILCGITNL